MSKYKRIFPNKKDLISNELRLITTSDSPDTKHSVFPASVTKEFRLACFIQHGTIGIYTNIHVSTMVHRRTIKEKQAYASCMPQEYTVS